MTAVKKQDDRGDAPVWAIRDDIAALETVKDLILKYFLSSKKLDIPTRKLWSADAKEAYYSVVASWEMLDAAAGNEEPALMFLAKLRRAQGVRADLGTPQARPDFASSSQNFLGYARSCSEQSASELAGMKDAVALKLEKDWREAFNRCHRAITAQLEKYLPANTPPAARIQKVSDRKYQLLCSVCGAVAATVARTTDKLLTGNEPGLIYSGITGAKDIGLENLNQIFLHFGGNDLAAVHKMALKNNWADGGLDCYCPQCDKVYCHEHYNVEDIYDEGFYDYSNGTCPAGHKRMLDD